MSAYAESIYNFEYFLNREYAFNRDKWKCRCCGADLLFRKDKHCHHVNRRLPMSKINDVYEIDVADDDENSGSVQDTEPLF